LGDRVATAIAASQLSQRVIAERCDASESTVSKWAGGQPPSAHLLPRLAAVLDTTVDFLMTGHDRRVEPVGMADDEKVAVPRLLRVAAGQPVCYPIEDRRTVLLDRKPLQKQVGPIPDEKPERVVFAADVKGDSMSPGIQDGDVLIVRRYYPPTREDIRGGATVIDSGELYVVAPDGDEHAAVKRLILTSGHELLVLSDNPRFKPKKVDLREVGVIQQVVLGRPVKLIRDL
jgi:SOS-response transcriptional repressor LexA